MIFVSAQFLRWGRTLVGALLGVAWFAAGGSLQARRNDAVTISAVAAPDYVRVLAGDGKLAPETYVFNEGDFFGGTAVDGSLGRMTFNDITRVLAVNLAAQEYYPTKDVAAANLLIRVFWGTTTVYDAILRNAALLGYRRPLDRLNHRINLTPEELQLRTELNEDRYFVVLVAYDYQLMRREKKSRILWITRLSIRGPGNNFTEALPALALAGAQAFGRNLDDLERIKVRDLPGGEVILGDLKVIGVEEKPVEKKEGR